MQMYDFVKMVYTNPVYAERLRKCMWLDAKTLTGPETGSIGEGIYEAKFRNLEFFIYPSSRVEIQGSLHKYWNGGTHNHNDFSLRNLRRVICEIQVLFELDPHQTKIDNLEFGLNINTLFAPNELLNNLIIYQNTPFGNMKTKGRGKGMRALLSQ
jgi:hypothetical protein